MNENNMTATESVEQAPLLTQFLNTQSANCPICKYNLSHLKGNQCPECGALLKLRVGLEEPRLAAYILTVISYTLGLGYSLPLTILFALHGGGVDEMVEELGGIMVVLILLLSLAGTPAILLFKSSFRRLNHEVQMTIAGISTFVVILLIGISIVTFD